VLAGPDVVGPTSAFSAALLGNGHIRLEHPFPKTPDGYAGMPVIAAKAALARLGTTVGRGTKTDHVVSVTGAKLGMATFETDRGRRRLPAWLFSVSHIRAPTAVLAVAPPSRYPVAEGYESGSDADVSADGAALTLRFAGGPPGSDFCDSEYTLNAFESAQTVVLKLVVHSSTKTPTPTKGVTFGCTSIGFLREATTHLTSPLGNRVVLSASGKVIQVGQCASAAGRTAVRCSKVKP
jgi:hypothetical protein